VLEIDYRSISDGARSVACFIRATSPIPPRDRPTALLVSGNVIMWGGFEDLTKLVTEATSALDDISKGKAIDLDFDKLQEDLDPKLVAEKKADGAARSALAVPSSGSVASAAEPTAPVVVSTPDIVAQANTPDVAALRQELDNTRQTAASEEAQRRALQEMIRVHVDTEVRSAFLFFQAFFVFFACLQCHGQLALIVHLLG